MHHLLRRQLQMLMGSLLTYRLALVQQQTSIIAQTLCRPFELRFRSLEATRKLIRYQLRPLGKIAEMVLKLQLRLVLILRYLHWARCQIKGRANMNLISKVVATALATAALSVVGIVGFTYSQRANSTETKDCCARIDEIIGLTLRHGERNVNGIKVIARVTIESGYVDEIKSY